jgi:Lar family restriction alleviation protein
MSEQLKPCPFCGATDVKAIADQVDAVSWHGEVECIDCEMRVSSEVCERAPELAIADVTEIWNRRAALASSDALADDGKGEAVAKPAEPKAQFDDPRVQAVYAILCGDDDPPMSEHWEGWVSRRIVDALSPHECAVPANVMAVLDRMCTPLDESVLKGATAEADAHSMKLIRDYVLYTTPQAECAPREELLKVGEASLMPGASAFTMACFEAWRVPVGAKLYIAIEQAAKEKSNG